MNHHPDSLDWAKDTHQPKVQQPMKVVISWLSDHCLEKPVHVSDKTGPVHTPWRNKQISSKSPISQSQQNSPLMLRLAQQRTPGNLEEAPKSNTSTWDPEAPSRILTPMMIPWQQPCPMNLAPDPYIGQPSKPMSMAGHQLYICMNQWPAEQQWWTLAMQEDRLGTAQSL